MVDKKKKEKEKYNCYHQPYVITGMGCYFQLVNITEPGCYTGLVGLVNIDHRNILREGELDNYLI